MRAHRTTRSPRFCLALLLGAGAIAGAPALAQDLPLAKLDRGDAQAGDLYACAVDIDVSGGVLTVVAGSVLDDDRGADSGSAYVFEYGPAGWRRTAKLVASGVAAGDQLGFSVALDGDRIVLGAPKTDGPGRDAGAAWIFRREGDGWAEVGRISPPGLGELDQLGRSVAAGGGRIALGAPGDDDQGPAAGAVWLVGGAGGATKLTAPGSRGSGLGTSVAVDATRVVGGAPFDGEVGQLSGAVWIFEPDGSLTKLLPPQPGGAGSQFGTSVTLSGDLLAVGARRDGSAGLGAGAVHVYQRTASGWFHVQKLVPAGLAPGDELGISVAFDGNVLYAGARFDDRVGPNAGVIHRFVRRDGVWTKTGELVDPASGSGDELGFAVAAAGGAVVTGRYRSDVGGTDAGEACVFGPPPAGPGPGPPPGPGPEPPGPGPAPAPSFAITKTADSAAVTVGGKVIYAISARNKGTGPGTATVADVFPSALACTWTCTPSAGAACAPSGAGPISDPVTLPAGSAVTYTATCAVPATAKAGTLTNTATITGAGSSTPSDISTAVVTVLAAPPVLGVSKTASPAMVFPGDTVTYTVVVANSGPGPGTATVSDPFPGGLACTWTCAGSGGGTCSPSGSGAISDTATLPPGAAATYVATCTVPSSTPAPSTLVNTATITRPDGSSFSSTATTTVVPPPADFGIEKSATPEPVFPGGAVTYTVTVTNAGPGAGTGTVSDPFPAGLSCTWTCVPSIGASCSPAGSGPISDPVTLPAGATVEYTAICAVPPSAPAPSTLVNTATITGSDGTSSSSTATTAVAPLPAEFDITKTASPATVAPGETVTYTITAFNAGSGPGFATVSDPFPAGLACTWTCAPSAGASCTAAGAGSISDTVGLPPGGSVVYTATCMVPASTPAPSTLTNTATITGSDGTSSSSTATTSVVPGLFEVSVSKSAAPPVVPPGGVITYQMVITNTGTAAGSATVSDPFSFDLSCAWTCTPNSGASCTPAGVGVIDDPVVLPVGSSVTYDAVCTVNIEASPGTLVNTVRVLDVDQAVLGSASASTDVDLPPGIPLTLSATATPGLVAPDETLTYRILVRNDAAGPELLTVSDAFPRGLDCAWTCTVEDPAGGPPATEQGEGVIEDLSMSLPSGATLAIDAACRVRDAGPGVLVNRVFVTNAAGEVVSAAAVAAVTAVPQIPTLSPALLVVLGLLLAAAGAIRSRRRVELA